MQSAFRSCALRREPCLAAAHAFVVGDVATPSRLVDLAASLGGGLVASVAHMARPPGPILRHGRALSQRLAVWTQAEHETRPPEQPP